MQTRNQVDYGPAASTVVTTMPEPVARSDEEKLTLVLASEYSILLQGSKLFYDPPEFIYNTSDLIQGVAIHIAKKLLFVADKTGRIFKAPLNKSALFEKQEILSFDIMNSFPIELSMDWLKEQLYILAEVDLPVSKLAKISKLFPDSIFNYHWYSL